MKWAVIPFAKQYEVSSVGTVRMISGKKLLKQVYNTYGYPQVSLKTDTGKWKNIRNHRLVLLAFVGEDPIRKNCAHNNGIKTDNRLSNLRWATHQENSDDQIKHGTRAFGEKINTNKLTKKEVRAIRKMYLEGGHFLKDIGKKFGVSRQQVSNLITGKHWKPLKIKPIIVPPRKNKTGYIGVTAVQRKRFVSYRVKVYKGCVQFEKTFRNAEDAAKWYDKKAIEFHGADARVNFKEIT